MAEFSELLSAGQHRTWDWWLERYFERLGVPDPAAAGRELDGGFGLWTLAIDGTIAALTELSAMGIRLGVVSNSDGSVRASLSAAGFDGLLEVVLDSAEEGVKKPDPAIFTSALRRLGAQASTCWHVGDSLHHDVEGALAAGLSRALLVDPYRLAPRGTDRVDSCADLPGLVKGARPA
jgi:HAD superfamily hydrolase (TIGR01509 family)